VNIQADERIEIHDNHLLVFESPLLRVCSEKLHSQWLSNGHLIWLFAGSEGGGHAAAIAYTLIETARLNDVDPQAWLSDVLSRIADHKITQIHELLPWNFRA